MYVMSLLIRIIPTPQILLKVFGIINNLLTKICNESIININTRMIYKNIEVFRMGAFLLHQI